MKKKCTWVMGALAMAAATASVNGTPVNETAETSGNWDGNIWNGGSGSAIVPGARPLSGDNALLGGSGTMVTISSDVIPSGNVGVYESRSNGGGLVVTTGGILAWSGTSEVFRNTSSSVDGSGSLTITGGILAGGASSSLDIARVGTIKNATGTVTQTGGTLTTQTLRFTDVTAATVSGSAFATYNLSGTGVLNVTGNLDPGAVVSPGTSTATFNFTGGTLNFSGTRMDLLNNGGTLAPGGIGVVGTSNLNGVVSSPAGDTTTAHNYNQTGGALAIDIASDTSFDKLNGAGATTGANQITLNGTLQVNMLSFTPNHNETFDIVTTDNVAGSYIHDFTTLQVVGLAFGSFSKSVITSGNTQTLELSYTVPEPASLSLLSFAGLGLLSRRRRTRADVK